MLTTHEAAHLYVGRGPHAGQGQPTKLPTARWTSTETTKARVKIFLVIPYSKHLFGAAARCRQAIFEGTDSVLVTKFEKGLKQIGFPFS